MTAIMYCSSFIFCTALTDQNTDCSSLHSSSGSSGDGTFHTEADFASAVAHAAELSGLTVVGTTVCDPNSKASKSREINNYFCISLCHHIGIDTANYISLKYGQF